MSTHSYRRRLRRKQRNLAAVMAFGALVATMDMATRAAPTEMSDSVTAAAVGTVSGAVALPAAVDPCPPEFCGSTCDVACHAAYEEPVNYCDQIQGCEFDETCSRIGGTYALCECQPCGLC